MNTENCTEILAKGSSGNSYTVRIYFEENEISVSCSCPAGKHRRLCKHVRRVMAGDNSILYNSQQKKIFMQIHSRLQKTTIPSISSELNELEILLENTQKRIKKMKDAIKKVILIK